MDFHELQQKGYNLIPIVPNGKKPFNGIGASHGTNDLEQIEKWAAQNPNGNWGITCQNIIVFDLDRKITEKGRTRELSEEEMLSHWVYFVDKYDFPIYPNVSTPSGGRHFYFRKPNEDIKGQVKISYIREGKEVKTNIDIRVGNQYVVAPGSVGENGKSYECDDEICPVDDLPDLPADFITDILPKRGERKKPVSVPRKFVAGNDKVLLRAKAYVDEIDPAIEGSNGSGTMFRAATAIFWGFALEKSEGWPLLLDYNARCQPPFEDWELEHKYKDVFDKPANNEYGWLLKEKGLNDVYESIADGFLNSSVSQSSKPENDFIPELAYRRGSEIEILPEKWLWEDRIAANSLTIVFGRGGVGKSTLLYDFIARITRGTSWPDGKPCPLGTVLFFSTEESDQNAAAKVGFLGGDLNNFCYVDGYYRRRGKVEMFSLDNAEALEQTIIKHRDDPSRPPVRLIVVDPIISIMGSINENSEGDIRRMFDRLNPILSTHDVSCIGIGHSKKPSMNAQSMEACYRLSGSQAFSAVPRAVWELAKVYDEDDQRDINVMLQAKCNYSMPPHGLSFFFGEAIKRPEWGNRSLSEIRYVDTEIDSSMDEYQTSKGRAYKGKRPPSKTVVAAQFVKDLLASGPRPSKEVLEKAAAHNPPIRRDQISRAKQNGELKYIVRYDTETKQNYWLLPDSELPTEADTFGQEGTFAELLSSGDPDF